MTQDQAQAFVLVGSLHHPEQGSEVPVDNGYFWIQPIIEAMEGVEQDLFQRFCALADGQGWIEGGRVKAARLVVELSRVPELFWMGRVFVLQLGFWVEQGWLGTETSANPLDFQASYGGCADPHL
eukprot:2085617-Lingulodinium_polyedra.AAC.1